MTRRALPHLARPHLARPELPHLARPELPHFVGLGPVAALTARRPLAVAGAAVLGAAVLGAGLAFGFGQTSPPAPSNSPVVAGVTASPSPSPAPTPADILAVLTAGPTATPYPADVAATTNGVLLPWYEADLATRKPIAVMFDDHWAARPQAGLSQADVVYQALAEGGIPRYMGIFQTQDPPLIGPIRSARLYFVAWAEEWQAMYAHVWGAPNAMDRLAADNLTYIWNADGLRWLTITPYMWRVDWRKAPHNAYSDGIQLRTLLRKLGGTAAFTKALWTFGEPTEEWLRPEGGTLTIPYYYNNIEYRYDRATNTYPRWATYDVIRHKLAPDIDWNNGRQLAPSVVVVLYMNTYALAGHANEKKGRLDIRYVGAGKAIVFQNGTAIDARWSKRRERSPTTINYASGPNAGQPIPFNRGQIFVQVVTPDMPVTWTLGTTVAPQY